MPAGRPPLGAELVDRLEGSPEARRRVQIVLRTLAGEMTIPQACQELDIGESRFHVLRHELLGSMVAAAEGKPRGRPPEAQEDPRVGELQQQIEELRIALRAAQIREELAVTLPQVVHPAAPQPPAAHGAESKKKRQARLARLRIRRRHQSPPTGPSA
jgi:hypothetical protein